MLSGAPVDGTVPAFDTHVSIHDFDVLSFLGMGSSSQVYLARWKGGDAAAHGARASTPEPHTGDLVAIKAVAKGQRQSAAEELRILRSTVHPYILGLHAAFQDPMRIYLVLAFAGGGDLLHAMEAVDGPLSEPVCQSVLAEIISALCHLHVRRILYRDLKPENVLIATDGHVLLADFGVSKQLSPREALAAGGAAVDADNVTDVDANADTQDATESAASGAQSAASGAQSAASGAQSAAGASGACDAACAPSLSTVMAPPPMTGGNMVRGGTRSARTRTIVGTPCYMAPEIVRGESYGFASDWWAVGVLLYEMLTTELPFEFDVEDVHSIFERLRRPQLQLAIPDTLSAGARGLVDGLLKSDESERLGASAAAAAADDADRAPASPRAQSPTPSCTAAHATVLGHAFFDGIDWVHLERKELPPPFVPRRSDLDSNMGQPPLQVVHESGDEQLVHRPTDSGEGSGTTL